MIVSCIQQEADLLTRSTVKKMETRERRKVVADLNGSSKGMANMKSSSDIWRGKHLQRKEIKVHNKIVYKPIKL
jgi:maltoporin